MASRGRAAALLAIVFLAGLVVGAGAAIASHDRFGTGPHRRHGPDDFVAHLATKLDLTPAQRDSVRAILSRRRASMDSLWHEVGPRVEALQQSVRADIRAQLDAGQQRKFVEMNKRFDAMRRSGAAHAPR